MTFILGMVIVMISTAMGRLFANRMAQRLAFFREYQSAMTFLTDQVVGLNLELYKALASYRGGLHPLLAWCARTLRRTPQAAFADIWRRGFERHRADFGFLTAEDTRFVLEGGAAVEALCINPSERQSALYLKRLGDYTAVLETEKVKKCKLYNTAGVLAGLLVALLVI